MASQASGKDYSEPEYAKKQDRIKVPFYHVNIEHKIPEETRQLLEKYSGVPREQQYEHILKIRDQAWDIRAYPCTGLGSWLVPQLCRQQVYPEILQRAKEGATVMDVGTFIGHDLRKLVYDGAPSKKIYGIDIVSHFDVGYSFFRDRSHFQGTLIEADFLSDENPKLNELKGNVDIVVISQVLHQWDWEHQVRGATRLTKFTKPGSLIVGNQIGNLTPHEIRMREHLVACMWRHDPGSFAKMFEEVGETTGTKWETQAWMRTFPEMGWDPNDAAWMEQDMRLLEFVARRLS